MYRDGTTTIIKIMEHFQFLEKVFLCRFSVNPSPQLLATTKSDFCSWSVIKIEFHSMQTSVSSFTQNNASHICSLFHWIQDMQSMHLVFESAYGFLYFPCCTTPSSTLQCQQRLLWGTFRASGLLWDLWSTCFLSCQLFILFHVVWIGIMVPKTILLAYHCVIS